MSVEAVGRSGFGWYLKPEHLAKLQHDYEIAKSCCPEDEDFEKFNTWLYDTTESKPWSILIYGNSFTANYEYAVIIDNDLILSTIKGIPVNLFSVVIPSLEMFFGCNFEIENLQFVNERVNYDVERNN